MIIKLEPSPRKNKRFRAYVITKDGIKMIDFGLKGGETYIDHGDKMKRKNYRARHLSNDKQFMLINELIPSPALLSFWLLWGQHTDINKNIEDLNKAWRRKHHMKK